MLVLYLGLCCIVLRFVLVFKDELGTLKGAKGQLFVKPGAVPKFHKSRPVPHAIKGLLSKSLID